MEEKLESAEDLLGGNLAGGATSPLEIWDMQERDRIRDGGLGVCMVVSMELLEGDNRSVKQAFIEVQQRSLFLKLRVPILIGHLTMIQIAVMAYQPLGLFRVHKEAFEKLPMVHNLSYSAVSVYHRADLFFFT